MNDRDPRRLLDANETEPVLRDALAAARARAPSEAQLARIAALLPRPGDLGGGGSSGSAPKAPPVATGSTLSGAAIGAALGVLVVGAGLAWQAAHEAPPSTNERAAMTAAAPLASSSASSVPVARLAVPSALATAARAARPIERPTVDSTAPETIDAPEAPAPLPEASAPAPAAPVVDAETEAHFLDRARAALDTAPAQALSLTEEHARRFPSGALAQEREVVAIEALSRLGRVEAARQRAQRFLAAFPGSVHRRRLEALLAP